MARCKLIAEVGIAHGGSYDIAKYMASRAIDAGADYVKYQLHYPEEMAPGHPWEDTIRTCFMPPDKLEALKEFVESHGAKFLCTPFSLRAAKDLIDMGCSEVKIGSGEAMWQELVLYCLENFHTVYRSLGMGANANQNALIDSRIVNLHCVSKYPTALSECDFGGMLDVKRRSWRWGISSHCPDITPGIVAMAHGAQAVEYHVTIDRADPDGEVALRFHKFEELAKYAHRIAAVRGSERGDESEVKAMVRRDDAGRRAV